MEQSTEVRSFVFKLENTSNTFAHELVRCGEFMQENEQLAEVGICKIKFEETPPNLEYFLKEIKSAKMFVYYNSSILDLKNELIATFKLSDYFDEKQFDERQVLIKDKCGDSKLFDMNKVTKIEIGIPSKTKCVVVMYPKKIHTGDKPIFSDEEKNVIAGSEIIANFMDWKVDDTLIMRIKNDCCEFYTNWNWMMAVVKKINTKTTPVIVMHNDIKKQFAVVVSFIKSL